MSSGIVAVNTAGSTSSLTLFSAIELTGVAGTTGSGVTTGCGVTTWLLVGTTGVCVTVWLAVATASCLLASCTACTSLFVLGFLLPVTINIIKAIIKNTTPPVISMPGIVINQSKLNDANIIYIHLPQSYILNDSKIFLILQPILFTFIFLTTL